MVEIKSFAGILNSDDNNNVISPFHHKMAKNLRFRGSVNNLRAENVEGTTLLPNPYLPTGSNQAIGGFYDELKQRIFTFNYNANGTHGIFMYDIGLKTWYRIALIGYNTDGDILAFTLNTPIYAVKMLYGDTTQGDALYWNNSQHEPCQINIKFALAGSYGTIKRTYINVIKAIPIMQPSVTYENDATVTVNNLRKKLFKFKSRYVFSDLSKSCWSAESELPLPINSLSVTVDQDATKNCRVGVVVPTGEADVTDIEIAAAVNGREGTDGNVSPNQYSDFFLIKRINKAAESVSNNDITTYRFYNDQAYTPINVEESQQLFDLVPLQANALEFLNGNVPIYGAILEGYNKSIVTGTVTSASEAEQTTQARYIFVVNQSGDSGFGTSGANIHSVVIGTITVGDIFTFQTTNNTITFTATAATTSNVISGLSAAAVIAGFTVVSSDTENLIVLKVGEILLRNITTPVLIAVSNSFVYDRNSRYNYVMVYFDKDGRSIGGLTSNGMNFQTINYTETATVPNIPKLQLSISSRPPIHAYYFQIGRTKNLSKLTKFEWVSFLTFKDADYAYIGIENLNNFIKDNPSAKHLAYDFASNDRIRLYKVLSGTVNTIYTDKDFEIQSQVFNPTINGIAQVGQFLKIALPTTIGTFNFGTSAFNNYFIELYTPAQSVANGLDLDYEFGDRYSIGNPGTVNAFHQGELQNQTTNLATPATFDFDKGDYYYRRRTISSGNIAKWTIGGQQSSAVAGFSSMYHMALDLLSSTVNTAEYTVQSTQAFSSNTVPAGQNSNYAMLKATIGNAPQFDISARIVFTSVVNQSQVNLFVEFTNGSGSTTVLELGRVSNVQANIEYTLLIPQLPFSQTFTFTAARNRMYFSLTANGVITSPFRGSIKEGEISLNESARTYTIGIIDPNFSDYFESAVNSNGRAWVVDPNAAQVYNPTLMRWGLAFQPNTNINQANRFRPLNFDEVDRGKGDIQQMKVRDRILRLFQNRACGQLGIYSKFIKDSSGTNLVSTTDEIITKNNVQYYLGEFGVGTMPTSLVSASSQDYFVDPVRGYQLRLSRDGLTPISELYKGQFYISSLFIPYTQNYLRPDGSYAKIMGCYNYTEDEYITVLQGGTLSGQTIPNEAFSFNERRNAYCSSLDILNPDWILSGKDIVYAFKNGELYSFDNTTDYCKIFGVQYYPSITLVFNDKQAIKKKYMALSYNSNELWTAETEGDIKTSFFDPNTGLQQISKLRDFNFSVEEGQTFSAFMRDINSRQDKQAAWHNGGYLGGNWVEIKLTYVGSDFSFLYLPEVKSIVSNTNLVTS